MIRRPGVFSLAVVAMLLLASIVCLAQPQPLLTRHVREVTANGQVQLAGRLPASQSMRFDIVLPLRHQPELDNFLQALYEPSSSSYRHFVTPQEFTARFGPSQEDYDAVIRFAAASGFKVVGGSRDAMDVQLTGSVASVEKALHVTMGVYQHPTENRTFFAPDREPTVDLPFRLWHISGLDNYSTPRPLYRHRDSRVIPNVVKGSCPGGYYCGSDMRAAYYNGGTLTGTGQNIALLELAGTDLADLTTYYKNVGQTEPYTPTLVSTGGFSTSCLAPGCDDAEQTLDMTQAMGVAPGSTMLYMYVCGDGSSFDETACLSAMSTASPLSLQISCSWAWRPADPTSDDPYYQKFAAQGQNFFVASGDGGSYPSSSRPFYYPAEDDYVTAVGGTDLQVTKPGGAWSSETAWVDSGGGISQDNIPIPAWQQLAGVINSSNKGSTTLRNIPDVAGEANFDFYVCLDQSGCTGGYGGTSFAAPMWAGFMALVNQQAIANGNPPLGFVNPAIYNLGLSSGYSAAFHDITSGGNGGFSAVTGYDLVTGWGSPIGAGLISALAGASGPSFTLSANPTSLSIVQGNSGTSTITVTPLNGFSGSVSLAASGLPSGVTAGFAPNPTTTTSTLTLTASGSAAIGTSTVTITGTSGSLTATTTVSLTVTGTGPVVVLTPTSLTFGKVTVGQKGPIKTVTVKNTGGSALSISGIAVTANYALVPVTGKLACGSSLAAGASCQIKVQFVPTQGGTLTGTLSITDNGQGSPQTVSLSGTGVSLTISPTALNFGSVTVGTTSASFNVTITNNSSSSVTINSITETGTKSDFPITNNTCGSSLAGGANCTVSVAFKPTAKGIRSASLKVSSNGGGSPQSMSLEGVGK